MKNVELCRKEAETLENSHRYFRWPHPSALVGWRRYGNCCVYCGKDLMTDWETLFACASTDHLLPKKYKELLWNEWNLVLSCRICNTVKGGYDCSTSLPPNLQYADGPDLTEKQHGAILTLCRKEVLKRRERRQRNLENALSCWTKVECSDAILNTIPVH